MFIRVFSALMAIVMAAVSVEAGGKVWTPKVGSDERRVVLNAARVPVERDLGQPVVFKIRHLRVSADWAFLYGIPQGPGGRSIDYTKSIYAEDVKAGAFNEGAAVLLARAGAGWRVVTYSVGFGDVVWDVWDEEFGAPEWLWP
jgi:hypothetical protein